MRFNPTAIMGNNPIVHLINGVRGGANPDALVQQMLDNHPQKDQISRIISGKSAQEIMSTAENMCRERGVSIADVLKQYGIEL